MAGGAVSCVGGESKPMLNPSMVHYKFLLCVRVAAILLLLLEQL